MGIKEDKNNPKPTKLSQVSYDTKRDTKPLQGGQKEGHQWGHQGGDQWGWGYQRGSDTKVNNKMDTKVFQSYNIFLYELT